jgi:hypothetical protein
MKFRYLLSLIALSASLGLYSSSLYSQRASIVDCDRGGTIQAAIDKQVSHTGPITVNVTGTCEEDIFVERDRVTINGVNTATVVGSIEVNGSDQIVLQNISITGSQVGMKINASRVILYRVTVSGIADWTAIVANENSSLYISESSISGNGQIGVFLGINSSLNISNGTEISNNGTTGLAVYGSSILYGEPTIQGNVTGIRADLHSVIDINNADISNNSWAGIVAAQDSAVKLSDGNTVSGNGSWGVLCEDAESSFVNESSVIADPVSCTDFNQ